MKLPKLQFSDQDKLVQLSAFLLLFLFAFYAMMLGHPLSWETIVLLAIALTPISISKISFGKDGLVLETYARSGRIDEEPANESVDKPKENSARVNGGIDNILRMMEENPMKGFPDSAQKVMRTLRYFQKQEFGEAQKSVWAFSIPQSSPDYHSFFTGVNELYKKGYVRMNPQGLVGLSNAGIQFSKQPGDWSGPMWTHFFPA